MSELLDLPSYGEQDSFPAALLVDAGVVEHPDGCVVLVAGDGGHVAALWPPGYTWHRASRSVRDQHGDSVWRAGERRDVGGGYSAVHAERVPAPCRAPRAWWVASVAPVSSPSPSAPPAKATASPTPRPRPLLDVPAAG